LCQHITYNTCNHTKHVLFTACNHSAAAAAAVVLVQVKRDFSDIILPGQLHDRVRALAATAANTKLHGAPYRHMLFYGEPSTNTPLQLTMHAQPCSLA
jgi:hypothetical protein